MEPETIYNNHIAGKIVLREKYGANIIQRLYVKPPGQQKIVAVSQAYIPLMYSWFYKIFLPQGFPDSVSMDYVSYQLWDTAQAFCSTIAGIIATQEILRGVGVGDENATPLAATVTWVVKDGCGHLGKILFAYTHGSTLDAYSKKWRLCADALNDLAMCLEIALPYFKNYTTLVLCVSSSMKAIVGVAGGATRVAMTQHHALRGNMADVSAKDAAQETAVNLVASILALVLVHNFGSSIIIFSALILLHILFNYMAVKAVCLNTLNVPRFQYVIDRFWNHGVICTPSEANSQEPVIYNVGSKSSDIKFCGFNINIGNSFDDISQGTCKYDDLIDIIKIYKSRSYLIYTNTADFKMDILLKENADSNDILFSYFHATLLAGLICAQQNIKQTLCAQYCEVLKTKKKKKLTDILIYVKAVTYNKWRFTLGPGLTAAGGVEIPHYCNV